MSRHPDFVPQGVIPAVLLPFHDDFSIDEPSFRAHLRDVAAVQGLSAITVNAHSTEVASCTEDEQRHIQGLDDFYTYWTRKEAFLKALGVGLTKPLRSVSVSTPQSPPSVVTGNDGSSPPAQLVDLRFDRNYAGALAVLSTSRLCCRFVDAADLLARPTVTTQEPGPQA